MPARCFLMMCIGTLTCTFTVRSQTLLLDKVRLSDPTTGKGLTISKPSGLTSGQILSFPSSSGAINEVLSITNVSGNSVDLGWTSAGESSATLSNRLDAYEPVAYGVTGTGPTVSASANKVYRVTGVIRGNRIDGGTTKSDNLKIRLSGPAGSTYTLLAVRCCGCPDGITGLPLVATAAGNQATSAVFNPGSYAAITICFEGLVKIGNTAGSVSVLLMDDGVGSVGNGLDMLAESYILLTEVE